MGEWRPILSPVTVKNGPALKFDSGSAYNITAQIKRPGVASTIVAKFDFKAP